MHKYSFKKFIPWSIVAWAFGVLSIAGFILMPLIDGMVKGGPTRFDTFTYGDALVGTFKKLISFDGGRSIAAFVLSALGVVIMLVWLAVIISKKHYRKLIIWGIDLVCVFAFIVTGSIAFAGTAGNEFVVAGNWLLKIGFASDFPPFTGAACPIGAIVGIAMGACGAAGLVTIGSTFIFELLYRPLDRVEQSDEEAIEAAIRARLGQEVQATVAAETKGEKIVYAPVQGVSDEKVRKIVHEECEMLYLRLIKYKTFSLEEHKEEKVVIKEEHVRRDEDATDDEYYKRMIAELGMFHGKQPAAEVKKPVVEEAKPAPVPVKKPAPAFQPKPVVVAAPAAEKVVRIPFDKRIVSADKVMKDHFNELKSEILSYGVKSRVSNSGDTFRLHTVTFVKVTIAGKSLKLYLALNPKDYKDSTLPIADASNKSIYKEIPLVFKVKSELSLRRAKQLIADAMAKGGLKQGEVVAHDWVKEIKNGNF